MDVAQVAAPAAAVVARRWRIERGRLDLERRETFQDGLARPAVEPGPDLSREAQVAVLVDADRHRPEILRPPFARRPATDHELLLGPDLELEPRRRPAARLVARPLELGDDAFEALGCGGLVEREALPVDVGREADARVRPEHALQQALAILESHVQQRPPIEVQQVERLEHEPGRALVAEPRLEEAEVGLAVVIERGDLAVDDRLAGIDPRRRREEPREVGLAGVQVAGPETDLAVGDDHLQAEAVPLDLEQPVGVAEGLRRERRQHRFDALRHGPCDRAGQVDLGGGCRGLADPQRVAVGLDVVVRSAGLDALRMVLGVPARDRGRAALGDEQPLIALVVLEGSGGGVVALATAAARPDDRPAAIELLAVELELELAVRDRRRGVDGRRLRLPGAPVPDDDVARAVLLRGDDALEVEVLDRMILDVDRHPAHGRVEGQALGHGPGHEDAGDLEAEVVMEPGGAVALDDETPGPDRACRAGRGCRCRLGVLAKSRLRRYSSRGMA